MKFWQAMKMLEEGYKVRCKSFPSDKWICKNYGWSFDLLAEYIDEEWELYEEVDSMNPEELFVRSLLCIKSEQVCAIYFPKNVDLHKVSELLSKRLEKPEKLYNFIEAAKLMAEGKSMIRKIWHPDSPTLVIKNGYLKVNDIFEVSYLNLEDILATDWMEIKE
jgi:hypothetical protein